MVLTECYRVLYGVDILLVGGYLLPQHPVLFLCRKCLISDGPFSYLHFIFSGFVELSSKLSKPRLDIAVICTQMKLQEKLLIKTKI